MKLVANRREVDAILASKIESDRQLTVEGVQDYLHHFNDAMFPNILANQSMLFAWLSLLYTASTAERK
ncbi:hypothetical protein [Nostoc sp. PA-18-2419]|uniref:hypothetical protein n=1 Tax=Nostoc sp. PA-18-2419 TaxID=2575443 RepID=UPI001109C58C|nr:hypothetical protein [Nostoc sp. PA-18-2419]